MKLVRLLTCGACIAIFAIPAAGQQYKWTGMRNPCKQSAEDGLNEKQLGKKIGKFIVLPTKDAWAHAIYNVNNRFPGSRPWVTWGVGEIRDADPLSDETHEEYLAHMDALGVDVFLELAPNRDADVPALMDAWLAKLKHHRSVKGLGVDLEYFKRVDDATAKSWDSQIKTVNPEYRLFLKHWEQGFMPPKYRGQGDLIFINTSSEATVDALNNEFVEWAKHFSPSAVAFQIGYPSDEDGMDGDKDKGWTKLEDPIRDWGNALATKIDNPQQEIGLLWVTAKSGKSYNADWDLTQGAKLPATPSTRGKRP